MSTLIHYIMSFIMYTIGTGLSPETTSCSVELSSPQEKVAITPSFGTVATSSWSYINP